MKYKIGDLLYRIVAKLFGIEKLAPDGSFSFKRFTIKAQRAELEIGPEHYWFRSVVFWLPLLTYGAALNNFQIKKRFGWAMLMWMNDSRGHCSWNFARVPWAVKPSRLRV